jgi:hypothetical protein
MCQDTPSRIFVRDSQAIYGTNSERLEPGVVYRKYK